MPLSQPSQMIYRADVISGSQEFILYAYSFQIPGALSLPE